MSETSRMPATIQHAMQSGLSIGLLLSLDVVLSSLTSTWSRVLHVLIEAYIIVRAYRYAKSYRDEELGGSIRVFQSFAYTLNVFFYASLIAALFSVIYYKYLSPEYLPSVLEQLRPVYEKLFAGNPNYTPELLESILTPQTMAMSQIMVQSMIGMLLGLLYAPFLKSSRPDVQ